MSFQVTNKVALVTGANRGIGKEIVKQLFAKGASKVYLAVRDLDSVASQIAEFGDKAQALELDLNNPQTIKRAAEIASDVDLVINNAGYLQPADLFDDAFEEAFKAELEVNALGPLRVAKAFDETLRSKPESAFVQINSVGSMRSFDGISSYCASKAASYTFTQALRSLWAEEGVQVVSVHPGPIATDMTKQVGMYEIGSTPVLVADDIISALAQGRFHSFPDPVAQGFESTYDGFAKAIVEADLNPEA